jgi:hypothetical protein
MLQATDVPSSRPNDRRASTGPHPSKENMISNPVTLDVPAYSRSRHRTPSACTNATRPSPSTARCCTSLPTPSAPSPATCSWLASSSACNSPRDRITPPGRPSVRRFNPHLCAHPGRSVETWKTPLDRAKEHRLEAYATLFSGLSSDLSEPSRELSPCTRSDDAAA